MNKEALLRLADLLDNVNPRQFNMGIWAKHIGPDGKDFHDSKNPDCRTAACACGWACSDPWFRRRGLHLVLDGGEGPSFNPLARRWTLMYRDHEEFQAAAAFFEIGRSGAYWLFDIRSYRSPHPSPKTVAKRIRAFVAEGQAVLDAIKAATP